PQQKGNGGGADRREQVEHARSFRCVTRVTTLSLSRLPLLSISLSGVSFATRGEGHPQGAQFRWRSFASVVSSPRSWLISDSRNRRWPPGLRVDPVRHAAAPRVAVL